MPQEIATKAEFDAILAENGSKLVIVDFTATWCGPCQRIAPEFVKLSEEYTDCVFIKVDVDQNSETSEACGISCMPTFQFYKNGKKATVAMETTVTPSGNALIDGNILDMESRDLKGHYGIGSKKSGGGCTMDQIEGASKDALVDKIKALK